MTVTICLAASTLGYPNGGGHRWVYLNWALGLAGLGCRVLWLESVPSRMPPDVAGSCIEALKAHLAHYGLADRVALAPSAVIPDPSKYGCLDLDAAAGADLLLNLRYGTPAEVVRRFRRTVLVDIDPGLLQVWVSTGKLQLPPHDMYFTIGETVGRPEAAFPDAGLPWHYTPPPVAVDWWPVSASEDGAPFTTVSHWQMGEWMVDGDEAYSNDKRTGFLPFLDLPRRIDQPLELALCFAAEDDEKGVLQEHGWRIRDAWDATATPLSYQNYIQASRGEFSCVKPSCIRLQNAWISDRTICYLASGKPAVVQHTGPSRFLPDAEGLIRFRTLEEAIDALERATTEYDHHCRRARQLAEEYFDARRVAARVLERALA